MTKKSKNNLDVSAVMAQIQEQLAVLDRKLDAFMTKSLTELAQALAAQKPSAPSHTHSAPHQPGPRPQEQPRRQMFAVVCFECGKDCEIPFKPSGDRPVYCQECFAKRRAARLGADQKPQLNLATSISHPEPAGKDKKKAGAKKTASKAKPAAKKKAKKK